MATTKNKRVLFGTDGVRDIANRGNMTPEMAFRLGRAFVLFLMADKDITHPHIVIGRDTRRSGMMLEGALSAGITSAGADVISVGVIPTPGVSYAVRHLSADGGAVISASHNPAEYNGIKYLDCDGCKLSDESELSVESYLAKDLASAKRPMGDAIGVIKTMPDTVADYAEHLLTLLNNKSDLSPKIAFDCAHGAASAVMPLLLKKTGAACPLIGANPDGMNINASVGVMNIQNLANYVTEHKSSLGFAFDGDADRCLAVDSHGRTIDGDILLWVLARWLARKNILGSGVVVTVMSNMALEGHLEQEGIKVFRCPVGDRYVLETMRAQGARLGGEQSGHIIADAFTSTGDGLCTALLFLNALRDLDEDAGTLIDRFGRYAQKLSNIRLKSREILDANMNQVNEIASEAQQKMQGQGRVFVRPSGTEPLLRVLVEAREEKLVDEMSSLLIERLKGFCE